MATPRTRTNDRIKATPVRLIGMDGEQIGILPIGEALQRAQDLNMDLVEIAPKAKPPVCRIMDYGKFKFELAKKEKQAKKKQHAFQMKEMRFRPKIDEHDYQFKKNHVHEFLLTGNKVRVFVMFRGREIVHIEFGRKILDRMREDLIDIAKVDVEPKREGNTLSMILSPKTAIFKRAQAEKFAEKPTRDEVKIESDDSKQEPPVETSVAGETNKSD